MYSISNSFYIWGAGTDIGKTVFCSAITHTLIEQYRFCVHYIKPVDTGGTELNAFSTFQQDKYLSKFKSSIIFKFERAVSPHRIYHQDQNKDKDIIKYLESILTDKPDEFRFIEGAGGVASPTLDGNLQCALYAPLKLPVVFIADFRLGGISNTLSNLEFARSYGFDISCILCFEGEDENVEFFQNYYKGKYPIFKFENIKTEEPIESYWNRTQAITTEVCQFLIKYNSEQIRKIKNYKQILLSHVWWPFTQHKNRTNSEYIDSANQENFSIAEVQDDTLQLQNKLDANQSWWTQNLGHGNAHLAQEMAYTAGRYGHVMFPGYSHEPAAQLIQNCLKTIGQGWANRVFFSDNGSTAVEVALKMAFKKRFGQEKPPSNVIILGLKDSYHGDTLGALDATEPNSFKNNESWYHGSRGIWMSYPQAYLKNEKIYIKFQDEVATEFEQFSELFDFEKRAGSEEETSYHKYLDQVFESFPLDISVGACLFEGLVLGACGMILIDPLFLRVLVKKCQNQNIPVIIDDVFAGLWRLGFPSSSFALQVKPDIGCFGKGITGGTMTLGLTLASEDVFEAFLGDSLGDALLHGHSYSGNPIPAAVANKTFELIKKTPYFNNTTNCLTDVWDRNLLNQLSTLPRIKRCMALGTLFAVEIHSKQEGYLSADLQNIVQKLKSDHHLEVRPLGNVLYIMANFYADKDCLDKLIQIFIHEFS